MKSKTNRFALYPIQVSFKFLAATGAILGMSFHTASAVIHVDDSATGARTGNNWTDAYTDLQYAIDEAEVTGEPVHVARGTYYPATLPLLRGGFILRDGVRLFGGFDLTLSPPARRGRSVLSGNIGVPFLNTDNSYHVIEADGSGAGALVNGFVIEEGYANGSVDDDRGGGIFIRDANPVFENCVIRNNYAKRFGGGAIVYGIGGTGPEFRDSFFHKNVAEEEGGALVNNLQVGLDAAYVLAMRCRFTSNHGHVGGAIFNEAGCSLFLLNSGMSKNTSDEDGGAVFLDWQSDVVEIGNCTIVSNVAGVTASGQAGGIYGGNSITEINHTVLWGNTDTYGFGEFAQYSGAAAPALVEFCDIRGWTRGGYMNFSARPFLTGPILGLPSDNYTPLASSPLVERGSVPYANALILSEGLDLDRFNRVNGATIDVGAVEY